MRKYIIQKGKSAFREAREANGSDGRLVEGEAAARAKGGKPKEDRGKDPKGVRGVYLSCLSACVKVEEVKTLRGMRRESEFSHRRPWCLLSSQWGWTGKNPEARGKEKIMRNVLEWGGFQFGRGDGLKRR